MFGGGTGMKNTTSTENHFSSEEFHTEYLPI